MLSFVFPFPSSLSPLAEERRTVWRVEVDRSLLSLSSVCVLVRFCHVSSLDLLVFGSREGRDGGEGREKTRSSELTTILSPLLRFEINSKSI